MSAPIDRSIAVYAGRTCLALAMLAASGLLASCKVQDDDVLTMTGLYQNMTCPVSESSVREISNQAELTSVTRASRQLLFSAGSQQAESDSLTVDFDDNMLVLVAAGQQTTAGYTIEQLDSTASISDGDLLLPVVIRQPAEGVISAQVITSPCAIYVLPRVEYSEIILQGQR